MSDMRSRHGREVGTTPAGLSNREGARRGGLWLDVHH